MDKTINLATAKKKNLILVLQTVILDITKAKNIQKAWNFTKHRLEKVRNEQNLL